jgi:hypothetical protein
MLLRSRPARSNAQAAAAGAALVGLAGIALSRMLRPEQRVDVAAVELAFIAGSYPAMALGADDPRGRATELVVGAGFAGCAFAGLALRSRALLAGGLLAHGAWDLAHHVGEPGSQAPNWYPLFCLLADVLLAQPLLGKPATAAASRVNDGLQ